MSRLAAAYVSVLRGLVLAVSLVAGLGLLTMMVVTCLDVVLRIFGHPLAGAFDLVRMAGAITMACALPYTTAVKGHVAIEYFFHKLSRRARVVVDTAARLIGVALFVLLARQSVVYGAALQRAGEVSATLRIPVFWLPWVIAFCCGLVALVILHNLFHPRGELIKP